jgi:hypothetical protein
MEDHPKYGAPGHLFSANDPKNEKFYSDWLTAQRVTMHCDKALRAIVMRLGKPDDLSKNFWNQELAAEPSPQDLQLLVEYYTAMKAAEYVRNQVLSTKVHLSRGWFGNIAPHVLPAIFYLVVFLAALSVLLRL